MRAKRVLTFAGYVMLAVLAWVAVTTAWLWWNQERVVFQPPGVAPPDPVGARRVAIRAPDGHESFAFVVPAEGAPRPTVVIAFHGNADLAAWLVPWARELAWRAQVTVVVPEYRGYGGGGGRPSYVSVAADALGALAMVRTLAPDRIVLYGHSLGSAIAAELAAAMHDRPPAALVLQSPFTSAREMAARMLVPMLPGVWSRVARVHYDTRRVVRELDVEVSVAHGSNDLTIPARMGRDVIAASRRPGRLFLVPGAGHNDVADVGGEAYWRWLGDAVTGATSSSAPVPDLEQQRGGRLP
jgi:hypothetical protein